LERLLLSGYHYVIAHVNYQRGQYSLDAEKLVHEKAFQHNLALEVLHVTYDETKDGNFEGWARKVRYQFFANLCKKHKLSMIFLGHHLDDSLESYLIQKEKKLLVNYYGIRPINLLYGCLLVRPLIFYRKKDILESLEGLGIPYVIDPTNSDLKYLRNQKRSYLSLYSPEEIETLISSMQKENKKLAKRNKNYLTIIADQFIDDKISVGYIDKKNPLAFLSFFLNAYDIYKSNKEIARIYQDILARRLNLSFDNYWLYTYQDDLYFIKKDPRQINSLVYAGGQVEFNNYIIGDAALDDKYYQLIGETIIPPEFFPLTIRTYQPGDYLSLKDGTKKKLKNFFIDKKIPPHLRYQIPLIALDKHILFVPGLFCLRYKEGVKISVYISLVE
jgi:tRNA(Ile)-lysidine synthase